MSFDGLFQIPGIAAEHWPHSAEMERQAGCKTATPKLFEHEGFSSCHPSLMERPQRQTAYSQGTRFVFINHLLLTKTKIYKLELVAYKLHANGKT